jgi:ubiquitin C-terminal hydrolase
MNYYHGNDNYNQINNSINSNISPSIVPNKLNNINKNQIIINNLNQKESKNNSNQNQVLNNNDNSNILYLFPKIGLKNIVGTYMNATLQCFLHVSELTVYFLCKYPYEKNYLINKNHGKISIAFYELVKAVCEDEYKRKKIANNYKLHSSVNDDPNSQKKLEKIETHSSNPSFSVFLFVFSYLF